MAADAAARFGDADAVLDGERRVSFSQLIADARRVTAALVASGIEPGERAAIWSPNRYEWLVAALGTLGAGAAVVPVNTRFKGEEVRYILERSGARVVFTVGRVPRDGLRRHRRRAARRPPEPRARRRVRRPVGGRSLARRVLRTGCRRRRRHGRRTLGRGRRRRRVRRAVHVGHHRFAQGRADDPRADAPAVLRLVRHGRAADRRQVPDRQPVLPHVRVQGRMPGVAHAGRDDHPEAGPRRRRSAAHGDRGVGDGAARVRPRSTSRSSTIPTATGSTCRRCGSRSRAPPTSPSS